MNNLSLKRVWEKYYEDRLPNFHIPYIGLYEVLKETAHSYRDHVAIIFNHETLTYEELKKRTDTLASYWQRCGLKKGDRIGLWLGNHPDYVTAYYASHALGLIIVPINPAYTPREVLQVFHDTELRALVVGEKSVTALQKIREVYDLEHIMYATNVSINREVSSIVHHMKDIFKNGSTKFTEASIDPKKDLAIIQYTGGTTGTIKGAMLTHHNLIANVYQSYVMYRQKVAFGNETILAATPLYHVYAMTSAMNVGIFLGARILLFERFDVDEVLNQVKKYAPTMFPGVPKMYLSFIHHPNVRSAGLNSLKICSSGSAPLPVEVIKQFKQLTGCTILEGFGMSETSPTTHRTPINGTHKHGSIGIPVPAVDCRIVDQKQEDLGINQVGELVIKGPQVMKGYWNNEKETAATLQEGWLFTGDLVTVDEDGYFYIVGRKKEMILFSGFNIYPQEVENVLYEHQGIAEVAVVGIPDSENGEIPKAFLVAKEGYTLHLEEIKAFCYTKLTPYKVPRVFEERSHLPRNGVGKLLKRLLVKEELERRNKRE
ncbi:long-chain-fatty-acid--CoA ligase [Cytobacillus kochii]|uniref:long-chain-fatty-acid--CoA ligase n=1 Tax=Cytobacillus kochii TaxID=859143 RepID=UPI00247FDC69|nr:long-chain fatty acid--CoA ligase [Cytobacillus kochii]